MESDVSSSTVQTEASDEARRKRVGVSAMGTVTSMTTRPVMRLLHVRVVAAAEQKWCERGVSTGGFEEQSHTLCGPICTIRDHRVNGRARRLHQHAHCSCCTACHWTAVIMPVNGEIERWHG